jgi:hypothetical protein
MGTIADVKHKRGSGRQPVPFSGIGFYSFTTVVSSFVMLLVCQSLEISDQVNLLDNDTTGLASCWRGMAVRLDGECEV